MKLLIIEQPKDDFDCFQKVQEEVRELTKARIYETLDRELSEAMDVMQAVYSYMLKRTDYDLDKIEEANKLHIAKLLGRGHRIIGAVNVESEAIE